MGTKNSPGKYDCYAKALPAEPTFTLIGRDPTAALTVAFWIEVRRAMGKTDPAKLAEAEQCARELETWARAAGKSRLVDEAFSAVHRLAPQIASRVLFGDKS